MEALIGMEQMSWPDAIATLGLFVFLGFLAWLYFR